MPEPPSAHCGLALSADGEDGYRRAWTNAVRRRHTKVRLRARPSAMRHLSAASRIGTWRSRGRPRRRRRPPPLCQRREPNASSSGRAPAAGCRSDRVLWFVSRRAEPNELSRELSSILGERSSLPPRRQFAGRGRTAFLPDRAQYMSQTPVARYLAGDIFSTFTGAIVNPARRVTWIVGGFHIYIVNRAHSSSSRWVAGALNIRSVAFACRNAQRATSGDIEVT